MMGWLAGSRPVIDWCFKGWYFEVMCECDPGKLWGFRLKTAWPPNAQWAGP
jgi:hypothetical protein